MPAPWRARRPARKSKTGLSFAFERQDLYWRLAVAQGGGTGAATMVATGASDLRSALLGDTTSNNGFVFLNSTSAVSLQAYQQTGVSGVRDPYSHSPGIFVVGSAA